MAEEAILTQAQHFYVNLCFHALDGKSLPVGLRALRSWAVPFMLGFWDSCP